MGLAVAHRLSANSDKDMIFFMECDKMGLY